MIKNDPKTYKRRSEFGKLKVPVRVDRSEVCYAANRHCVTHDCSIDVCSSAGRCSPIYAMAPTTPMLGPE